MDFKNVATRPQTLEQRQGSGLLDIGRKVPIDLPARRVAGRLRLLIEIKHAHQCLEMSLRLHIAAHHSQTT